MRRIGMLVLVAAITATFILAAETRTPVPQ